MNRDHVYIPGVQDLRSLHKKEKHMDAGSAYVSGTTSLEPKAAFVLGTGGSYAAQAMPAVVAKPVEEPVDQRVPAPMASRKLLRQLDINMVEQVVRPAGSKRAAAKLVSYETESDDAEVEQLTAKVARKTSQSHVNMFAAEVEQLTTKVARKTSQSHVNMFAAEMPEVEDVPVPIQGFIQASKQRFLN